MALALAAAAALVVPQLADASLADEQALAKRFAPVVRLVSQAQECGSGESYEPIDVNALFDQPTVALRGPWSGDNLVKIGPAAPDLTAARYEYHLDFPGSALDPGCGYEKWGRLITKGTAPAAYAHVVADPAHPGKLALQYWFYYVFNDWNNTHEGDWEMVQLDFDAATAAEALTKTPTSVGYSQHEGGERSTWDDSKLELVDGTHPVVHPAAGSHANFYGEALYLGSSASEGVGCDDTRGPTFDVHPVVQTIPSDPAAALGAFPWIGFGGRWGELQRAFFNGPTGPNLKSQWTEPITWSEDWRGTSIAVPGGGAVGTGATDFFCGAVAKGSNALRRAVDNPLPALLTLIALIVLLVFALTRTTWRPAAPFRLARRRAWGQILSSALSMYGRRLWLFLGIGILVLPVSVIVTLLQAGLIHASSVFGVETEAERGGLLLWAVLTIGSALTLVGLGFVMAATARALAELDAGRTISPLRAYRLAVDSIRPLLGALVIAAVVVSVCFTTIFLLPIAIWLAVRWALLAPSVELEELLRDRRAAAERSAGEPRLVQGRIAHRRGRGARDPRRAFPRRAAHPRHERAPRVAQRHLRARLRGGDAVRRARDRLRLLRHASPGRARARARAPSSFPRRSSSRADPVPTSASPSVLTLDGSYVPGAFFDEMFEAPGRAAPALPGARGAARGAQRRGVRGAPAARSTSRSSTRASASRSTARRRGSSGSSPST